MFFFFEVNKSGLILHALWVLCFTTGVPSETKQSREWSGTQLVLRAADAESSID